MYAKLISDSRQHVLCGQMTNRISNEIAAVELHPIQPVMCDIENDTCARQLFFSLQFMRYVGSCLFDKKDDILAFHFGRFTENLQFE